ncbi:hypothetical protein E4H12_06525 [Candidatus Thorarchaeota archaeon]|nr:MAG: hypothetical protein E4H12_06525 [Candidatus Thorarchaeota archaeon]
MLLLEIARMMEMARPAKICPDCGKSMAGHHYWYKGGWKCKKANRKDGDADKKEAKPAAKKDDKKAPAKKEAPAPRSKDEDEKEHSGVVKGLEREPGEEKDPDVRAAEKVEKDLKKKKSVKAGETISASDMSDINADSASEARSQINSLFPKASAEQKTRAMNVWKARHRKKD